MRGQIEERKRLQERTKEIRAQLSVPMKTEKKPKRAFRTTVLSGERLRAYIQPVEGYKKRACFETLKSYLCGNSRDKVFILYGLRRTGKTTLIRQAIADMGASDFAKRAFIQIRTGNTLAGVNADLQLLSERGFRFIFLDEVTLMDDFIESAALFSDVFAACGMKIVLSGTDSLGFVFSMGFI